MQILARIEPLYQIFAEYWPIKVPVNTPRGAVTQALQRIVGVVTDRLNRSRSRDRSDVGSNDRPVGTEGNNDHGGVASESSSLSHSLPSSIGGSANEWW